MTAESEVIQLQRDWIVACEVAREASDALRLAQAAAHAAQAYRRSAYLAYAHALDWDIDDPWLAAQALLIRPSLVPMEGPSPAEAGEGPEGPSEAVAEVTLGEASVSVPTVGRCRAYEGARRCVRRIGHSDEHLDGYGPKAVRWTP